MSLTLNSRLDFCCLKLQRPLFELRWDATPTEIEWLISAPDNSLELNDSFPHLTIRWKHASSLRRRQRLGRVSGKPARPPVAVRPSRGICSFYLKKPSRAKFFKKRDARSRSLRRLSPGHYRVQQNEKEMRRVAFQRALQMTSSELHCWAGELDLQAPKEEFRRDFDKNKQNILK